MEKEKNVIVFDDTCPFCQQQIARIKTLDKLNRFEYVPRTSDDLLVRFPVLNNMDFESGMRLITPAQQVFVGADAIHKIAEQLPATKPVAWLYKLPGINCLSKKAYAWIAANRHKFGPRCKDNVCG